ncbi:unnamed protein product [Arabis nemorensis]|uniref:TFIIS central domain-containing protein n=1 Tax=Arabis nemorensis TaxID=586526 RepID=A0A565BLW4_9BRAS|nr:unnamed protein product [Arabis nemorensis]
MELMSIRNPNSSLLYRAHSRPPVTLCAPRSLLPSRRHFSAPQLARPVVSCTGLRFGFSSEVLLNRSFVAFAASHEDSEQSGVEVGKEKSEDDTSPEAWKQTLASFKEQVSKMQSLSSEAYTVNSQKAMTILKDTSEQLRIQAEKAKEELGTKAKEVSEEGREYILKAAEESPSDVKEIVEAFASTEDLKDVSRTQDFHVGIPYGLLLLVGGFISFMVSGSIAAIRFGVILGGALFALSLASLKSQRKGESSTKFLKGQMAIVAIIFFRELWWLLFQRSSFPGFVTTLTSGGVLAFYVYKLVSKRETEPNLEEDGGEEELGDGNLELRDFEGTMESELIELFEAAKKSADAAALDGVTSSGPEVSRCLDALKQLKKFPVTYDTLVATQVGKKLRSLAKHPVEDIKSVATDLLEIWKKVVIEETAKAKKTESTNGCKAETVKEEKVDRMDVERTSNPAPVKVQKLQRGDSAKSIKVERKETDNRVIAGVKVERKEPENKVITGAKIEHRGQAVKAESVSTENQSSMKAPAKAPNGPPKLTSMVKCNDPVRDKIRELLGEALSKVHAESDDYDREKVNGCDPFRVAVSVESHMYEKLGRSTGTQKLKYRSIMFNLKDKDNPDLRRRVLTGEVSPEKLITMSAEEMASDKRKQENNQIKEKFLFNCEQGPAPKASTDQFKCGRCGQRKCTYYQMQTRSADEPMTTYVTCVNCNNHWKFC